MRIKPGWPCWRRQRIQSATSASTSERSTSSEGLVLVFRIWFLEVLSGVRSVFLTRTRSRRLTLSPDRTSLCPVLSLSLRLYKTGSLWRRCSTGSSFGPSSQCPYWGLFSSSPLLCRCTSAHPNNHRLSHRNSPSASPISSTLKHPTTLVSPPPTAWFAV